MTGEAAHHRKRNRGRVGMTIDMLRLAMRSFASEPMAVNREE